MTPSEFAGSVDKFSGLNTTEKIKRFCWYLVARCGIATFNATDVKRCFEDAKYPVPSSVQPFLTSLAKQSTPFLIRTKSGFSLSRHAHEQFDRQLGNRPETIAVTTSLKELPSKIAIQAESTFLQEAINCFQVKAFRATIVMTWNLTFDHFCNSILGDTSRLASFNTQLPIRYPKLKAPSIAKREDFSNLKEGEVLEVAKSAGLISKDLFNIMDSKLKLRNTAAHPSSVVITQHMAEGFVLDLAQNVLLTL